MANEEHLSILKQGVVTWKQWRIENPEATPDLRNADLRNAILSSADLSNAILSSANLSSAKIGRTVFVDVDLSEVKGLETIEHQAPSSIGIDTIYKSKGNIPYKFLLDGGCLTNV